MSTSIVTATNNSCSAQQTTLEQLQHLNYQSSTGVGCGSGEKSLLYGAAAASSSSSPTSSLLAHGVTATSLADLVDTSRCIFLNRSDLEDAVKMNRCQALTSSPINSANES